MSLDFQRPFKQKLETERVTWRIFKYLRPPARWQTLLRRKSGGSSLSLGGSPWAHHFNRECLFFQAGWSTIFLRKKILKYCQFSGSGFYRLFIYCQGNDSLNRYSVVANLCPLGKRTKWGCVPRPCRDKLPFSLLSHFQGFGGPWALEGTILKAASQNEEEILATSPLTHRQDQLSSLQSWWKQ